MNDLYPIFLKLDKLRLLIVGAGEVGYEKLSFILKSSPNARVKVVATWLSDDVKNLLQNAQHQIEVEERAFDDDDVLNCDIVIAATNDKTLNLQVQKAAKANGKLVNVADTPTLCDFYLGSVVTKGNLKLGISTNGKSPTMAKRLRETFENILPEELDDLLSNLESFRNQLKGDFTEKVKALNDLTQSFISSKKV